MTRKLGTPSLLVIGIVVLVSAAWIRNTVLQSQKNFSDRALKRDITPVRW